MLDELEKIVNTSVQITAGLLKNNNNNKKFWNIIIAWIINHIINTLIASY